jgi:hypothetical protein
LRCAGVCGNKGRWEDVVKEESCMSVPENRVAIPENCVAIQVIMLIKILYSSMLCAFVWFVEMLT